MSNWHFNPFGLALYVCGTFEIIRMALGGCYESFPPPGPAHNEIKIISSIIHVDTFAEFSTRENERKFSSGYKGRGTSASRRVLLPYFFDRFFRGVLFYFLRFESPESFWWRCQKFRCCWKSGCSPLWMRKKSRVLTMAIIFFGRCNAILWVRVSVWRGFLKF